MPCILACRALNASAKPPAILGVAERELSGVPLPLSGLNPILTALSLGVGTGAGFFPIGRFAGGAGGVGFAFAADREAIPLATAGGGGGGGGARAAAGGGASSLRYADGVHP